MRPAHLMAATLLVAVTGCGSVADGAPAGSPGRAGGSSRTCAAGTLNGIAALTRTTARSTPRGLACALLAHVPGRRGAHLSGTTESAPVVEAAIDFDDPSALSYYVVAYPPEAADGQQVSKDCDGLDSGYRAVVCRTTPDGARLAILRAGSRTLGEGLPLLIGRASRPDGSALLLEIHTTSGAFPQARALEVLTDRTVGWQTTPAVNEAGLSLPDFTRFRIEVRVSGAGPEPDVGVPQPEVSARPEPVQP